MTATLQESRVMTTTTALRQARADLEVARSLIGSAKEYLDAAAEADKAIERMKRTFQDALTCGQALVRIYESDSYQDTHGSWAALCRDLNLNRPYSYRLMQLAKAPPPIPEGPCLGNVEPSNDEEFIGDIDEISDEELAEGLTKLLGESKEDEKTAHAPVSFADRFERFTVGLTRLVQRFSKADIPAGARQHLEAARQHLEAIKPHLEAVKEIAKQAA